MEDSTLSIPKGKRNTSKTESLTPGQALEILQQSIIECHKAGIDIQIVPKFFHSGTQYCGVLMANVNYMDGNLLLSDGKEKN